MKHFHSLPAFLPGIAALLLGTLPSHALPLSLPLLKSAPLAAILPPLESQTPPLMSAFTLASPVGGLNGLPLWNSVNDPSLCLTDWQHVFDIAALGAFDIPLRDDPAERTNILLSSQAVDNVTILPGAEFSFNAQVGERTPERGYQDGLMFDNGHVIRGTGGGICLVATGLYNAALHAGLEITERHPHSGVVSYAPPGCDAGIVYGQEDFKFRNTTGKPLVIRAQAEENHVSVRLFGHTPPPGQQVIVKLLSLTTIPYAVITKLDPTLPPGQSVVDQKPRSGYDVVLARFWTVKGQVVRREIVTRERRAPRPKIVRVAVPSPLPGALTDPLMPGQMPPLDGTLPVSTAPDAAETPVAVPKTDAEPGD